MEQCGLLAIEYEGLDNICGDIDFWRKHAHPLLLQASPAQRYQVLRAVLDQLRKDLVLDAALLQSQRVEQLEREVRQAIKDPWCFDEYERHDNLNKACWASTSTAKTGKGVVKLTPRSKIGRFLRSPQAWPWRSENLSEADYNLLIQTLVQALADAGYLLQSGQDVQLRIDAMVWTAQLVQHIPPDPLTSKRLQGSEVTEIGVNQFFQEFFVHDLLRLNS